MTLIDDVLDAVTDPDTGLWDALDATYTAAHKLEVAAARRNGSIGAERMYRRAQDEVESACELVSALDPEIRCLFDALLSVYDAMAEYRAAATNEALDEYAHPVEGGSLACESAANGLSDAEGFAREALAKVLAGELVEARVAA